jgi:hypothetical protein
MILMVSWWSPRRVQTTASPSVSTKLKAHWMLAPVMPGFIGIPCKTHGFIPDV